MAIQEDGRIRNPDWRPPAKNYGGEDIPEYFALMFYDETAGIIFAKNRSEKDAILAGYEAVNSRQNAISQSLKDQGAYFYEGGGSIFMDFKIMRGQAYRNIGLELGERNPEQAEVVGWQTTHRKFDRNMSTEEALQAARDFVNSWNWVG